MHVLGIWDGHDAGACIVEGNEIKVAVNEERFTKRKLDVGFPVNSINACLDFLDLKPTDISLISVNTSDFAKTLTRAFPFLKDNYYLFRRRKIPEPMFSEFRRHFKYRTTEIPEVPLSKKINIGYFKKNLNRMGFKDYKIDMVDHHSAHSAATAICSGFKKCISITLDGVGDGLSGTINIFEDNNLERISEIPARDSFGIFFEQVTTLLGMRELEDEGKVMALSDFAYHVPDEDNILMDFFEVDGLRVRCKYSTIGKYKILKKLLWNIPREQLAYMAQRTLEKHICQLFENSISELGIKNVCWSGGVASNIKVNMKVRLNSGMKKWFVFPHMGDGGLAVGSALYTSLKEFGCKPRRLENAYLGNEFSDNEIKGFVENYKLRYEYRDDISEYCGELLSNGNFLLWYQGRMEYGPRALGNRSIIAPSSPVEIKDKLNLQIKKRSWFQPFCPSLLEEDADRIFEDVDTYDRFMTMGFMTREEIRDRVISVINIDGSARPQMLGNENPRYRRLIDEVKKNTGLGIILNTSFNLHGYPIVNTPEDAIDVFIKTKAPYMAIGNCFIENR
ncbi:MAG TPA: hypothetical protein EYP86_01185 [Candidatus Altiarchaeales archaeon]|nr:hypothetical protein [Candidatus Altiarchaeales archaeon]